MPFLQKWNTQVIFQIQKGIFNFTYCRYQTSWWLSLLTSSWEQRVLFLLAYQNTKSTVHVGRKFEKSALFHFRVFALTNKYLTDNTVLKQRKKDRRTLIVYYWLRRFFVCFVTGASFFMLSPAERNLFLMTNRYYLLLTTAGGLIIKSSRYFI